MQQKIILIAAVVFAILAFFLSQRYMKAQYDRLYAGARKVKVMAASKDLPSGTTITLDNVGMKEVFESAVRGGDIVLAGRNNEIGKQVLNKTINTQLKKGGPLRWSYFDIDYYRQASAALAIKSGKRALSIPAAGVQAVSGLIKPNDRIDIIATYSQSSENNPGYDEVNTTTLIQDVNVIATGTDFGNTSSQSEKDRQRFSNRGFSMITIEVSPEEAELIVHVVEAKGSLTLTLRNPDDGEIISNLPEVDAVNLKARAEELNLIRSRR